MPSRRLHYICIYIVSLSVRITCTDAHSIFRLVVALFFLRIVLDHHHRNRIEQLRRIIDVPNIANPHHPVGSNQKWAIKTNRIARPPLLVKRQWIHFITGSVPSVRSFVPAARCLCDAEWRNKERLCVCVCVARDATNDTIENGHTHSFAMPRWKCKLSCKCPLCATRNIQVFRSKCFTLSCAHLDGWDSSRVYVLRLRCAQTVL